MTIEAGTPCPSCGNVLSVAFGGPVCYDCLSERVRLNDEEIRMLLGHIDAPDSRLADIEQRVESYLEGPAHEQSELF